MIEYYDEFGRAVISASRYEKKLKEYEEMLKQSAVSAHKFMKENNINYGDCFYIKERDDVMGLTHIALFKIIKRGTRAKMFKTTSLQYFHYDNKPSYKSFYIWDDYFIDFSTQKPIKINNEIFDNIYNNINEQTLNNLTKIDSYSRPCDLSIDMESPLNKNVSFSKYKQLKNLMEGKIIGYKYIKNKCYKFIYAKNIYINKENNQIYIDGTEIELYYDNVYIRDTKCPLSSLTCNRINDIKFSILNNKNLPNFIKNLNENIYFKMENIEGF